MPNNMKTYFLVSFLFLARLLYASDGSGWSNSEPSSPETFIANAAVPVPPLGFNSLKAESAESPLAPILTGGNSADLITPEIQSLADGLQNDPIKIFNHVFNHIDFQAYYGSKKGALMTMLEGKGNAFDTSSLLVSLLRASGYEASYKIGPAIFNYSTLSTWLGLTEYPLADKTDAQIIAIFGGTLPSGFTVLQGRQFINASTFLTPRGYPIVSYVDGDHFVFDHVWVRVTIGGVFYEIDPSLKGRTESDPTNFLSASGYNRTTFLNAVGGTAGTGSIGTNSIKQISQTAIATQLSSLSTAATSWLRMNRPTAAIDTLLQGRRIDQREISNFNQAFTISAVPTPWHPSILTVSALPESYMAKLNITLGVYNYTSKAFTTTYHTGTIKAPELMGKKLALTFNGSGASTANLYLEDTIWRTQNVPLAGVDIKLEFTHDHYEWVWNGSAYVKQSVGKNKGFNVRNYRKGVDFAYALPYGFDVNGKLMRLRQEKLDRHLRNHLLESSREVRTEVLNIIGLNWLYQTELSDLLVSANTNVSHASHHRIGRVGQEEAFYIDVDTQQYSNVSRATTSEMSNIVPVGSMFQSAMEHSVIEQTQGTANQAASTIKMLHLANQANKRIFRANSGNWTTGANIRGQLTGFAATLLAALDASIAAGGTILVPEAGNLVIGSWTGSGYAAQTGNATQLYISGGYKGAFNSQNGLVSSAPLVNLGLSEPGFYSNGSSAQNIPYTSNTPRYFAADPVDMATGSFNLDKLDLQLGATEPRGLSFSRHYDANRRFDNAPGLGYGWTHNYYGRCVVRSSIKGSLGEVTPAQMVPWLVAAAVARDVYGSTTTAKAWAVPTLIAQWATDQLTNNGVSITMGANTIEFVKMPDGSYAPPAGSTMTLAKVSNQYKLTKRHGTTITFRTDGWIESIRDLQNNQADFAYSGGNLTSVTDCYGRVLTLGWSGGRITTVSDGTGRSVGYGYSPAGDLISATDVEGKIWYYDHDTDHQIQRLRDPLNRTITENFFDSSGRVVQQKSMGDNSRVWKLHYSGFINIEEDPTGAKRLFYYDDRGRSIGVGDALGNTTGMAYDGQDHLILSTTPKFEFSSFEYDADHNLIRETDPQDEITDYFYDAQLRLQRINDKMGDNTYFDYTATHQLETLTNQLNHAISYTYHPNGLLWTMKDAENKTTTTLYDAFGNPNKVTYQDATFQSMTSNARGDVLTITDPEGRTVTSTYNKRRQPLTSTLPTIVGDPAATITNAYDDAGNLESTTDAKLNITSHTYNALTNHLASIFPALPAGNNVITSAYDVRDWATGSSNSLGHTATTEYDAAHRSAAVFDPLNRRTENLYDANGRATQAKDPLNRVTQQIWNSRGEKERSTDALNKNTDSLYNRIGNLTKLTNRRGKFYLFGYDFAKRPTSFTTPTGKNTVTTYFGNNQVKTIQEPSTQTTTLAYNGRNLVQSKIDPTGTITYGYDNSTLLKTVTESATVITRTYDERGRLKTFTTADGDLIQYKYDANNNLTRLTYPDGKQVNYTYNARNLLVTVTDWSNRTTTYTYDRLGRLTGTLRPNGTANQIAHDAANQLTSIKETSGGKLINYLAFQYDAAGQIKSRLRAPLVNSGWQHPALVATYDDDNRLLTANGTNVTHDVDGNMTRSVGILPTSLSTAVDLTYNSRNQLTNAAGVSYTYDAEGRRRTLSDATGTTRDIIDPSGKLLVRISPSGTKTYYVYGLGLLYEANQADATKTYHFDQVGSTLLRTDDSGKVIGQAEYSAYGLTTWKQGDMATPFLYNGQAGVQTDPNGLLNMRARYYSPYLMRFLNADPIGFSGGSNWFAYADGNPISLSDPFGLCADRNACTGGTGRGGVSVPFPDLSPITNSILGVTRSIGDQNPWIGEAISAVSYNLPLEALGPNPGMFFEGLVVKGAQAANSEVTVYRAFGGDSRAQGFSWTTADPRTVSNFRDVAGLPSGGASGATNTAEFLIQGKVNPADIIKSRPALPLDGNRGGLPEFIIDPNNVRLNNFSVLKP